VVVVLVLVELLLLLLLLLLLTTAVLQVMEQLATGRGLRISGMAIAGKPGGLVVEVLTLLMLVLVLVLVLLLVLVLVLLPLLVVLLLARADAVVQGEEGDVVEFMELMRTEFFETLNPRGRKLTTRLQVYIHKDPCCTLESASCCTCCCLLSLLCCMAACPALPLLTPDPVRFAGALAVGRGGGEVRSGGDHEAHSRGQGEEHIRLYPPLLWIP